MKKITTLLFSLACFLTLGAWAEESTYVAMIEDQGFETLQAALDDAQDGETVTLIADTTESVLSYADITLHINAGVTLTGNVYYYTIFNGGTLTIEGEGTIKAGGTKPSGQLYIALYNSGTMYVKGCTIESANHVIYENGAEKTAVSGGMFSKTPAPWLASGYVAKQTEDKKYYVVEKLPYTAKIGEVEYETLQSAIDAVEEGQMIELACATDEEINFNKDFVVAIKNNGNNYGTITGAQGVWERWAGQYSNVANYVVISKSMEELVDHVTANLAKYSGVHGRFYIYNDWTLSKDVTIPTVNDLSQSIFPVKDTFVLDLNGFTLDQAPVVNSHGGYPTIVADYGKKVTIKDCSEGKTGILSGIGWALDIYDHPETCVTLESGTITTHGAEHSTVSDMRGRVIRIMGGKFIMNGGAITLVNLEDGHKIFGIITASTAVVSTPHIEINGGYVECATEEQLWNEDGSNPNCLIGGSKGKDSEVSITNGSFTANPPIEYFAESSRPVLDEETGLYTVVEVAAKVVSEGDADVFFTSLKEAFAAADGKTVKLLKNQQLDVTNAADSLSVPKGATITFDMNGYILAGYATKANSSQLISNSGTLIIMDSSDTEKDGDGYGCLISSADPAWQYDGGDDYSGSYASNLILNKGNLIVESGYLENATANSSATYVVDNNSSGSNASLTVNGGWLYQYYTQAIRQFANSTTYENNVTINGGIVEGYYFEWLQLPGNNISVAPKANLTVNGGYLKNTDASGNGYAFYAYSYGNSRRNVTVKITGGFWYGWVAFTGGGDKSTIENIEITGGYYDTDILSFAWSSSNPNEATKSAKFIKGGCFAKGGNWLNGICPGYGVYDNEDPETMAAYPYEVRLIPVVELTVTENEIPIKVQEDVLSEIVGDDVFEGLESEDPEVRAEAEQAVIEKLETIEENGNKVWENYVMGIKSDDILHAHAEQEHEDKIEVKLAVEAEPPANSGFTVSYAMDYTDTAANTTTLNTLDIDLDDEAIDPTGIYQVKAILTPDNGGEAVVIDTQNKVGVVKATQPTEIAVIAVPWKQFMEGDHISVSNLVKTANLTPGDKLYIYEGEKYDVWALDGDRYWQQATSVSSENGEQIVKAPFGAAHEHPVGHGTGVFLERQKSSVPYYLYGEVDEDASLVTTVDEERMPIANPNLKPFDLNGYYYDADAKEWKYSVEANEGDVITIPMGKTQRKCIFKDGGWGYYQKKVENGVLKQTWVNEVKIPAGTGCWYIKNGENNVKIDWASQK